MEGGGSEWLEARARLPSAACQGAGAAWPKSLQVARLKVNVNLDTPQENGGASFVCEMSLWGWAWREGMGWRVGREAYQCYVSHSACFRPGGIDRTVRWMLRR
eukprot:3941967-Rhodomonas_salina.7